MADGECKSGKIHTWLKQDAISLNPEFGGTDSALKIGLAIARLVQMKDSCPEVLSKLFESR